MIGEKKITEEVNAYMSCESLLPTSLTPEILEKNGWKRDKLVPYIYWHEAHNIEVICTPNTTNG